MRRLKVLTAAYLAVWSLLIGGATAAYLDLVNWVIDFFWKDLPQALGIATAWRPLVICLPLSLVIGYTQAHWGAYPKTIAEILTAVRQGKGSDYHHWWQILLAALLIMGAGASVGPEASASGLVAGMIYWLNCRYKLIRTQEAQLATAGLSQQLRGIWLTRTAAVNLDQPLTAFVPNARRRKTAYLFLSLVGVVGLATFFHFFPQEGVFGFHRSTIHWQWGGLLVVIPALVVGWLFGAFFVKLGLLCERLVDSHRHHYLRAFLGGVMIAAAAAFTTDLLFSGEFRIIGFASESLQLAPLTLLAIALLKAVVTNLGFALGWRGGTIFPAIFSALAAGACLAHFLPWMPRLTVTIVMTTALTVILEKPLVTAILLWLLLPVQFSPVILVVAYLTSAAIKRVPALKP